MAAATSSTSIMTRWQGAFVVLALVLSQQVLHTHACPFALLGGSGMLPTDMASHPHSLRNLLSKRGGDRAAVIKAPDVPTIPGTPAVPAADVSGKNKGNIKPTDPPITTPTVTPTITPVSGGGDVRGGGGNKADNNGGGGGGKGVSVGAPQFCPEAFQSFIKCESSPSSSFSPLFYESKGCRAAGGVWSAVVRALDSYVHPAYGSEFVKDCYAALIRNVFHMDVGTGHNGILLLEDYGSRSNARSSPETSSTNTRSAKYAGPNQTLRCYDIYEYLRTEVDKYTEQNCKGVYVSCTDLTNFAAKYAHWKLSSGRFLPCFNFGFADAEPEDFSGDSILNGRTPKDAAETCLPPHDSTDTTPPNTPPAEALSAANFNSFFTKAIEAFTSPCYPTSSRMSQEDLSNILTAHTVGESHCFHIQLKNKEPWMDTAFFNKLAADCDRCRAAVASGSPVDPSGDFASNMNPNLRFSFAQRCKTAGQKDYLPERLTSGINRVSTFVPETSPGQADPCCVPNDVFTSNSFDFAYFPQVLAGLGLFEVDNGLAKHPATTEITVKWARCSQTKNLLSKYQEAWNKMNLIGAKPYDGKRRKYCSAPTWAQV